MVRVQKHHHTKIRQVWNNMSSSPFHKRSPIVKKEYFHSFSIVNRFRVNSPPRFVKSAVARKTWHGLDLRDVMGWDVFHTCFVSKQ
mmetsp:Transcript_28130/g.47204  ORF Transcript_28130/g.47204 Transcript_28130/m.47204 type:complete len:86 (-) Transcript_28130:555-812(-)